MEISRRQFIKGLIGSLVITTIPLKLIPEQTYGIEITELEVLINPSDYGYIIRGLAQTKDSKVKRYFANSIDGSFKDFSCDTEKRKAFVKDVCNQLTMSFEASMEKRLTISPIDMESKLLGAPFIERSKGSTIIQIHEFKGNPTS